MITYSDNEALYQRKIPELQIPACILHDMVTKFHGAASVITHTKVTLYTFYTFMVFLKAPAI